jgi:hypothetical protein
MKQLMMNQIVLLRFLKDSCNLCVCCLLFVEVRIQTVAETVLNSHFLIDNFKAFLTLHSIHIPISITHLDYLFFMQFLALNLDAKKSFVLIFR